MISRFWSRRPKGKLIICGTGRAGTTFLMRVFTESGMDTGFAKAELDDAEKNLGRAGLERRVTKAEVNRMPQVIKSPWLVDALPDILEQKWFEIALAIVPVRLLEDAARSRIRVHNEAITQGLDPASVAGGLWKTQDPAAQKQVLAEQFYRTVQLLVAFNVPLLLVSFPRLATERDYFDENVARPVAETMPVSHAELMRAFQLQTKPELISKSSEKIAGDP